MNILLVLIGIVHVTQGQSYEDARCKCICTVINETQIYKKLYISNVPPNNDCDSIILPPTSGFQINNKTEELCPRCQCKYESRNTTIIKVVVIIVVWVISLLLVYMMFLICLDPLLNNRLRGSNYMEHTNEEVCSLLDDYNGDRHFDESPNHGNSRFSTQMNISTGVSTSATGEGTAVNVLNRVSHHQDKWKRQVREQRKNIYDKHTMLN
ncbi:hypothetical protein PGB90_000694 [Kerria lacca]